MNIVIPRARPSFDCVKFVITIYFRNGGFHFDNIVRKFLSKAAFADAYTMAYFPDTTPVKLSISFPRLQAENFIERTSKM